MVINDDINCLILVIHGGSLVHGTTLWCYQTWLVGKSPNYLYMEVSSLDNHRTKWGNQTKPAETNIQTFFIDFTQLFATRMGYDSYAPFFRGPVDRDLTGTF